METGPVAEGICAEASGSGWHIDIPCMWSQGTALRHAPRQVSAVYLPVPLPLVCLEMPKVSLLTLLRPVTH